MSDTSRFVNRLVTSILAGILCGAVVGGIGGRLAMFLLRLTSDDRLRGLDTDDGFEIGAFTGSTIFLVLATAFLGAACGAVYFGIRRFVPLRWRPVVSVVLFGALGGAFILQPGEFDFTLVEPPALSVAMFIAIPAMFGAALSVVAEQWLATPPETPRPWYTLLPLIILGAGGSVTAAALLVIAIGTLVARRSPAVQRAWQRREVTWAGRAVLAAVVAWLLVVTVSDAAEII